jgi:NhaA family Na+:H+ antiporter
MSKRAKRPTGIFGAVVRPIQKFLSLEASSGILLLLSAAAALVWANLDVGSYRAVFDYELSLGAGGSAASFTFEELINDGLMAIFFFLVGMEIKHELVAGELRTPSRASLPAIAALGGMLIPAGIFLAFNWGGPGQHGWGVPMATDIAFCIGILTILKNRVPHGLTVFVVALAIFDDIGGILVIAFFYGSGIHWDWLGIAGVLTGILFFMNRRFVSNVVAYVVVGGGLWYAMHHAGIHATIAGVILGLMIPARPKRQPRKILEQLAAHVTRVCATAPNAVLDNAEIAMIENELEDMQAPVDRFVEGLHPFVAFLIIPLFALANSGVSLAGLGLGAVTAPVSLGVVLGLFVGKQVGIFLFTALAVRLGIAPMPGQATIGELWGASIVAGIGFTVALFIAALAFPGAPELLDEAKLGILLGSLISGVVGFLILRATRIVPTTSLQDH